MAFVQDDPNSPDKILNPGAMGQPPQTASGVGSGTGVAGAPGTPQGVSSVPTSSKAPPVANLGDYLRANAPQAQGMADKITSGLEQGFNQVTSDINAGQGTFEGQVAGGSVQANPDVVARAAANPADFVMNPDDLAAFQKQMTASYTGPEDFTGSDVFSQLSGEVQKAAQNAPNPNNPDPLRTAVTGAETNPTPGMTTLDTLLVQGTPGAGSKITAAQAPYATLQDTLNGLVAKENATAAAAKTATNALPAAATAPFTGPTGTISTFTQGLADRLAKAQQGSNDYNKEVSDYVSFLNDLQGYLGPLEAASGGNTLGWTPQTFSPVTAAPSLGAVATPQDYSTQAALESLLGKSFTNAPLVDANAPQAGTFQVPTDAPPSKTDIARQLVTKPGGPTSPYQNPLDALNDRILYNGSGWGPAQANYTSAELALIDYLMNYDSADYLDTMPGNPNVLAPGRSYGYGIGIGGNQ